MSAKLWTLNFRTSNVKYLNKCQQNMFAHSMPQTGTSETSIIFLFMFVFGQNTSPSNIGNPL